MLARVFRRGSAHELSLSLGASLSKIPDRDAVRGVITKRTTKVAYDQDAQQKPEENPRDMIKLYIGLKSANKDTLCVVSSKILCFHESVIVERGRTILRVRVYNSERAAPPIDTQDHARGAIVQILLAFEKGNGLSCARLRSISRHVSGRADTIREATIDIVIWEVVDVSR